MKTEQRLRENTIQAIMHYKGFDRATVELMYDNVIFPIIKKCCVVVDENQKLPDVWDMQWCGDLGVSGRLLDENEIETYKVASQDMLKAGFKRVRKLEGG